MSRAPLMPNSLVSIAQTATESWGYASPAGNGSVGCWLTSHAVSKACAQVCPIGHWASLRHVAPPVQTLI